VEYLQLSNEKKDSLRLYMQIFKLPLLDLVYGDGDQGSQKM